MSWALQWYETHNAIYTTDLAYKAAREECTEEVDNHFPHSEFHVEETSVRQCCNLETGDALKQALTTGPVAISVHADQPTFRFYRSGLIDADCEGSEATLDHGIVAYGYGIEPTTGKFGFMVKNSWGQRWGLKGMGWVGETQCGINADFAWAHGIADNKKVSE